MQRLSKCILTLLAVLSVSVLFAQNRTGSPYTRYGVGDLLSRNFGDSRAMGGSSLAMRSPDKLYVANPASYSAIDSLHFVMELGLSSSFKQMQSGDQSVTMSDMNLSYLSFGFPVTSWWGASAGILPYSNVGYDLISTESSFGLDQEYNYYGSGGLNQAYIGNSFSPMKNLSLGININYMFGNIYQSNSVSFEGENEGMLDIIQKNSMYFSDFYFTFGAQYKWELNKNHSLTFGAIWENNNSLNAKRDLLVTNMLSDGGSSAIDTLEFVSDEEGSVTLPMSAGFGLSYQYKDVLTLAGDVYIQDWSDSEMFGETDSLGVSQRVSFGAEYTPDGKYSPSMKYLKKVRYRAGVYYNDTYLQFDQGKTKINDFGISFGLGLPMKRSNTTFNLSLELGQRGSLDNNLVREQYVMFGMNFTLSDIWFIKRKFD